MAEIHKNFWGQGRSLIDCENATLISGNFFDWTVSFSSLVAVGCPPVPLCGPNFRPGCRSII